jgi:hypothetical protein
MVCLQHVPDDVAEEITLYLKMRTVGGRIDNAGEVYSWRLGRPRPSTPATAPPMGLAVTAAARCAS